MKTPELLQLLSDFRWHLGKGEWALLTDVPNSTGYDGRRRCDALAMNLYPSAGLGLHGFELKVSRNDWVRELRQPDKATELQRFCDRWWLVAGDDSVCPNARDLPDTWGMLVARDGPEGMRLVIDRPAPALSPVPLDRGFVAAIVRKIAVVEPMVYAPK